MDKEGTQTQRDTSSSSREQTTTSNWADDVGTGRQATATEITKDTAGDASDVDSTGEPLPEKEYGIQLIEAITTTWSPQWLYFAYALIWLIYFTDSLQQESNYSWTPYVTSSFQEHGLLATTGIVAQLVAGIFKFPLAKIIDIVGRPTGFIIMVIMTTLSLVIMAACNDIETYAAAQVFYWTGLDSLMYVNNMFINDTSKLRNRTIMLAFTSTPFICNTFAGPAVGQAFLDNSTWRWGYGAFSVITPVMCMPFFIVLLVMVNRVKKQGKVPPRPTSGRTFWESTKYYLIEFDIIGLILLAGGFSIFLLPFSLAAYQPKGWASPLVICMIVFGIATLALWVLWERFLAPKSIFPFHLLKNKALIAACLIDMNLFLSSYVYNTYFSSYLQVVFGISVSRAGWVGNIYNLVSCAWGVVNGFIFKFSNRYKWVAVVSVPIQILFIGLMNYFRKPGMPLGYLIMSQVFTSISTASLIQCATVGLMSSIPHEYLAVGLALQSAITSIGNSVGYAIGGAMWTQMLLPALRDHLPEDLKGNATTIYASLVTQLSYPVGSPGRDAIIAAYGEVYSKMLIVGTCLLAPLFLWVYWLKDQKLSEHRNLKGTLF